jgi:outer membrane protein OmpA-like peptidoglycan-associated protein/opacity protein-like surface antigen
MKNTSVMNQINIFKANLKTTLMNTSKVAIMLLATTYSLNLKAQNQNSAPPLAASPLSDEAPKLGRFSLGLKLTHLYDLRYTSYDLLSSGFSASDPYGMNGSKTKFDLAAGLEMAYYFSPLFSMDLAYEKGKMTGANKSEYYESNVSFVTLGANIDLKRSLRTKEYNLVPYLRISIAHSTYDAERRFISDDAIIEGKNGNALQLGVGLGLKYHINNKWCLNLMSEFVTINTDAWDGYDYGTGKDQMIKSSLGLRYTFTKGKHVDRTLAWQDNRVDRMQSRIDDQVNTAIKSINDSVDQKFRKLMNQPGTKDSDDDGIVDKFDKCPDVAGLFSNNGCPPVEEVAVVKEKEAEVEKKVEQASVVSTAVPASNGNSSNVRGMSDEAKYRLKNEILIEMNPIRFGYNSYQLNAKAYEQLNVIAVIMRNNPSYKISLTGYTDDDGSADYNRKLAESRANAVSEYLQSRGISKDKVKIMAMGKESPLDDNTSRIGKANNRRVECKLE